MSIHSRVVVGVLLLCGLLAGSSARAVTGALTFKACPGDPQAVSSLDLDCASGGSMVLLGTLRPDLALPDLVGIDVTMDLTLMSGTLTGAPFWNFDYGSTDCTPSAQSALSVSELRPGTGCDDRRDVWNDSAQHGSGALASMDAPNTVRIKLLCYRQTPTAVAVGERLFGFQMIVDMANATEAGGTCAGCPSPLHIDWYFAALRTASGSSGDVYNGYPQCHQDICSPDAPLATVTLNDHTVPTRRNTWGQLKALYR